MDHDQNIKLNCMEYHISLASTEATVQYKRRDSAFHHVRVNYHAAYVFQALLDEAGYYRHPDSHKFRMNSNAGIALCEAG